jgi:hypothetical protein
VGLCEERNNWHTMESPQSLFMLCKISASYFHYFLLRNHLLAYISTSSNLQQKNNKKKLCQWPRGRMFYFRKGGQRCHKHKVISSLIQPVQVILFFISFCLLRTSVCSHERRYSGWSRHQMVWVPTIIESQNVCSNLSKSLPSHCKDYKRISYYHGSKFWSRQTVKDSSGSGR